MDFNFIQQAVMKNADEYEEKFQVKIDKEFAMLKLYEELGEFTQAVLIHERRCRPEKYLDPERSKLEVAKELADVVGMAIVNAHRQGIDLEAALKIKWIKDRTPESMKTA